ncbi:MAG TPA: radical SAM protein [Methanoculleus sp.]|nr:radical SAM protein [Methanoculleus sp.]
MNYHHLFGPVPSRRLGVSLGIDLVPHKTCNLNCIYCECGPTTDLTLERREYVPTDRVLAELDDFLEGKPALDYITFSGSGEPTLHAGIGTIIRHIRTHHPAYRIAVLTNGCLFFEKDVRDDVRDADVIIPSLDAATARTFRRIDRPHRGLAIDDIISGLVSLREEFSGAIWLEVFIIPGINDTDEELAALKRAIERIRPDKIQINTLDRPGVVDWIRPATAAEMAHVVASLHVPGVHIIGRPASRTGIASFSGDLRAAILQTLRRRPCTVDDLAKVFGLHPNEINKYIQVLVEEGAIQEKREERGIFFVAT